MSDNDAVARTSIERVLWTRGHRGDMCAYVTAEILGAISDAGLEIVERPPADSSSVRQVNGLLRSWLDTDEPMVSAIGDTLARSVRLDSQEQARRVLATVMSVLAGHDEASDP